MQQLISFWTGLDARRKVVMLLALGAVVATVMGLSRLATAPNYTLLYSGLEAGAAGEVVAALEQRGVQYQVRGGSIFVDATQRDQLRMTLASEGLPMLSGQGYELLDKLSGFGTTSQMFDAAYWRAKEGELARTIQASTNIRSARVHIANSTNQPFRPSTTGSASVTAISSAGKLSPANAQAMRYLVASAVAGLSPSDVAVIDGRTGQVISADDAEGQGQNSTDRSAELKRNVERLLEARVGAGNAIVEINLELVTQREAITERTFDPEGRVAISSEVEESTNSASDSGSGAVTVASNLPDGDAEGGAQNSQSQNSQTREITNYEVSETMREILKSPGAVKKITTAVLVNGVVTTDPDTGAETWAPRDPAEIDALRELVASAIGFDEARGDTLTIKSMELTLPDIEGAPAGGSLIDRLELDVMRLIQMAVLSVVALVLGLFVLRPLFARPPAPAVAALGAPAGGSELDDSLPPAAAAAPGGLPDVGAPAAAAGGLPPLPGGMPAMNMAMPALDGEISDENGGFSPLGAPGGDASPVDRLRQMIEERQDEGVEIIRSWIEDEGERA